MEGKNYTSRETKELAIQIAKELKPGSTLALYGDLGSGKTTFTRYLVEALEFDARVQSPTFIIERIYSKQSGPIKRIYHLDLYRFENADELAELGLDEVFEDKEAISIIEWPELIEDLLPKNCIKLYFEYSSEDVRNIYRHNN